eukprot:3317253-Amphidinium_carterae.2
MLRKWSPLLSVHHAPHTVCMYYMYLSSRLSVWLRVGTDSSLMRACLDLKVIGGLDQRKSECHSARSTCLQASM